MPRADTEHSMKKIFLSLGIIVALSGCASNDLKPEAMETNVDQSSVFSMYGNWCGLYYPKDISKAAPPIDELDATCMRHDLCYVAQGQYDCSCDQAFEENLRADLTENLYTGKQRIYARSFQQYILTSPCHGTPDGKIGASRALQNMYMNTTRKANGFYEFIRGNRAEEPENSDAIVEESAK